MSYPSWLQAKQRCCYLCYQSGDVVGADGHYDTTHGQRVDVCDKHLKLAESDGMRVRRFEDPEEDRWEIIE